MLIKKIRSLLYIQGTNEIHWSKIISISIITIILIILAIYGRKKHAILDRDRKENAHYTIGVTDGRHKNLRSSSPDIDYYYWVNGRKYSNTQSYPIELDIITNDGKYFVEFSSKDPSNAKILLDRPVPHNQEASPPAGWEVIPSFNSAK